MTQIDNFIWSDVSDLSAKLQSKADCEKLVHIHVYDDEIDSQNMLQDTFKDELVRHTCSCLLNFKIHTHRPEYALIGKYYTFDVLPCSIFIDLCARNENVSTSGTVQLAVGGFVHAKEFVKVVDGVIQSHKEKINRSLQTEEHRLSEVKDKSVKEAELSDKHQTKQLHEQTRPAETAANSNLAAKNDGGSQQATLLRQRANASHVSEEQQAAKVISGTPSSGSNSTSVRIQLRYLDGSFENTTYKISDSLSVVRQTVADSGRVQGDFVLSCKTSQPPRDFDDDDFDRRLDALGLAPSAVLLVKPTFGVSRQDKGGQKKGGKDDVKSKGKKSKDNSAANSQQRDQLSVIDQTWALFRAAFALLLIPFLAVWSLLNVYVVEPFRSNAPQAMNNSGSGNFRAPGSAQPHSDDGQQANRGARSRRSPAAHLGAPAQELREGRIRRFVAGQPDDDPNATWNGNSTQQL